MVRLQRADLRCKIGVTLSDRMLSADLIDGLEVVNVERGGML